MAFIGTGPEDWPEFDLDGGFVRTILAPPDLLPPHPTGHPQGLAVDSAGTLYYADLALEFGRATE